MPHISRSELIYLKENSAWLLGWGARHLGKSIDDVDETLKGDQVEFWIEGWNTAQHHLRMEDTLNTLYNALTYGWWDPEKVATIGAEMISDCLCEVPEVVDHE